MKKQVKHKYIDEKTNKLDLSKLLKAYATVNSKEERAEWDVNWESRLVGVITEIHNANFAKSPSNTARVANAYVEIMSAIDTIQRRNL